MLFNRTRSDDDDDDDGCAGLSELAAPSPVENRQEGHLYRHTTLEESQERNNEKRNHNQRHHQRTYEEQPGRTERFDDPSMSEVDCVVQRFMVMAEIKLNCNVWQRQHSALVA